MTPNLHQELLTLKNSVIVSRMQLNKTYEKLNSCKGISNHDSAKFTHNMRTLHHGYGAQLRLINDLLLLTEGPKKTYDPKTFDPKRDIYMLDRKTVDT